MCCRNERFFNKPLIKSKLSKADTAQMPTISFQPECGRRNNLEELSHASEHDIQSTWPHMCTIWNATITRDSYKKEYICGASLIAQNMVLTTAHNIK